MNNENALRIENCNKLMKEMSEFGSKDRFHMHMMKIMACPFVNVQGLDDGAKQHRWNERKFLMTKLGLTRDIANGAMDTRERIERATELVRPLLN